MFLSLVGFTTWFLCTGCLSFNLVWCLPYILGARTSLINILLRWPDQLFWLSHDHVIKGSTLKEFELKIHILSLEIIRFLFVLLSINPNGDIIISYYLWLYSIFQLMGKIPLISDQPVMECNLKSWNSSGLCNPKVDSLARILIILISCYNLARLDAIILILVLSSLDYQIHQKNGELNGWSGGTQYSGIRLPLW